MTKSIKKDTVGTRIALARKSRGLTQSELASAVDVSRRVIAYYEIQAGRVPADLLARIAKALSMSADELLELNVERTDGRSMDGRFFRNWGRLSDEDKRTVTHVVEAILAGKSPLNA